jgi:5-methylcytosine-specific restriction protein A
MSNEFPTIPELKEGNRYNREELHQKYGGTKYRGIAPSQDHPYVFIFTGESGQEHGYRDEFHGDTFIYTGEGREGDMEMERGNRAIRDHKDANRELHLFESTNEAWIVTYLGQYECADWFEEQLPDTNGNMRDAIRFKLQPVDNEISIEESSLDRVDTEDLYNRAAEASAGTEREGETATTTTHRSYSRSEVVKEYALRVADGVCQGCRKDAPFFDEDDEPYLEVHHLFRRRDGGPDHPDNVIALCPNCHRRVHHGKNGQEFNEELIEQMDRE